VRLEGVGASELKRLRAACAGAGAFCEPHTLRKIHGLQRVPFLVGSQIASSLGLLALGLACLGLYGLARFAVVQRTREFGVRMALGATFRQILSQVLAESTRRSGLGIVIGLPVSLGLSALLASQVPFLESFAVAAYALVPLLLLACVVLASLFPALRAAAIDPIAAIRED
jgi:ABC-type antimicrobial peptide transport system permease subunit